MPANQRQEAKKRTRHALIEAGAALFAEQGLDAPSLDAICERAGFTRGAFYVHFSDRDDFLVAVMRHVGGPVLDVLFATDDGANLATTAARFLSAFADGSYPLGPAGGVRPHQLLQACARSEQVRKLYVDLIAEAIERLGGTIAVSQKSGAVRCDVSARQLATLLLAAVIGAQTMMELDAAMELPQAAGALMTLLASPTAASA